MYTYFADFRMEINSPEKEIWGGLPMNFFSLNVKVLKHSHMFCFLKYFQKTVWKTKKTLEEYWI